MLPQSLLLELNLGISSHVLKAATATQIGKMAGRRDALCGWFQHFQRSQFIKFAAGPDHLRHHRLTRQSPVNKLGFAVIPGNTPAVVAQVFDVERTGSWGSGFLRLLLI